MTLEIGAGPRTRGGRRPPDLTHLRSSAYVSFVRAMGTVYARAGRQVVAKKRKQNNNQKIYIYAE